MGIRKNILCFAIAGLAMSLAASVFHHRMDNEFKDELLKSDIYIMEILCQRIDERDAIIEQLLKRLDR